VIFFTSVNNWQRTRLFCALCALATTLLKDKESAQDKHIVACNFAKYLPILKISSLRDLTINLSLFGY